MAMRSLAGKLTPLPRRVAGYATKTSPRTPSRPAPATQVLKQKQTTPDRAPRLPVEQDKEYFKELFRAERRKAFVIAAAGWGTLAYIVGSSFRVLLMN